MNKFLCGMLLFSFVFSSLPALAQKKSFTGSWTRLETTYEFSFELHLEHNQNQVSGYFDWRVTSYDEKNPFSAAHYKERLGLTAREYVKGTYDPATRSYHLFGYKKEDPHRIIGLDEYRLKVDEYGQLGGDTKAHGSWAGRINGEKVEEEET